MGDIINVIDGCGSLLSCKILSGNKNSTELEILERQENFGAHNYHLTMAVCPTKNIDRYEWFLEKATEMGLDRVVPVIGDHSERKIVKSDRCNKILLSAAKQSLKGAVPTFDECCSVKEFIESFPTESSADVAAVASGASSSILAASGVSSSILASSGAGSYVSGALRSLKLIAYCGEATKLSVKEAIECYLKALANDVAAAETSVENLENSVKRIGNSVDIDPLADECLQSDKYQQIAKHQQGKDCLLTAVYPQVVILIGPEGDFSPQEVELAIEHGFIPVHLGKSRLRTETAAVVACCEVYSELG